MFDPITAALITSSPQLAGLDLGDLPKRLTEAYADIVAARDVFAGHPRPFVSRSFETALACPCVRQNCLCVGARRQRSSGHERKTFSSHFRVRE